MKPNINQSRSKSVFFEAKAIHVGNIQNSSLLLNKIFLICKEIENMYQLFRYTCIIFMFREETRLFFTYKFQSFIDLLLTLTSNEHYFSQDSQPEKVHKQQRIVMLEV